MQATDRGDFRRLLGDVMAFYRQDVSEFALGVWWQACQPFGMDQVRKALNAHAIDPDRGQFAPKPADLVRQLRGTQSDRSLIAWGKVLGAMRRVGAYTSVVFDDGAIHAAIVDMGGWPTVCRSSTDELPFIQKRFTDLHRAYSGREGTIYPPSLAGELELRNGVHGYNTPAPTLIGDPEQARKVQRLGIAGGKTQITTADAALQLDGPRDVA
jgi:hypothetical protein